MTGRVDSVVAHAIAASVSVCVWFTFSVKMRCQRIFAVSSCVGRSVDGCKSVSRLAAASNEAKHLVREAVYVSVRRGALDKVEVVIHHVVGGQRQQSTVQVAALLRRRRGRGGRPSR